jgi:ATP-binding cassette, subfamily F, member 3
VKKLKPLQKQLNKTEADMSKVSLAMHDVRTQLENNDLYTEDHRQTLADLLKREGELKVRAEELDEIWLDQQQVLEELSQ